MARKLIVNADDFGYTLGVTKGIIKAHTNGIVTSTSVMVNMPNAREALALARDEAPSLGLGLHLNLTSGRPLSNPEQIPDLVAMDGRFKRPAELMANLPALDITQVECELRAQIDHYLTIADQPPDHLDSHHHSTYLSPAVARLMISLAAELGVPIRRPLPAGLTDPQMGADFLERLSHYRPDPECVSELLAIINADMTEAGVGVPENFITSFVGNRATLDNLRRILREEVPEGVSEIMCHPAIVDDELRADSRYTDKRAIELDVLTHTIPREVIEQESIQLVTFADL